MDPKEASDLIASAGGNTAFARLIGLADKPGYQQRIHNWKRRGIPAAVILQHLDTFSQLRGSQKRAA